MKKILCILLIAISTFGCKNDIQDTMNYKTFSEGTELPVFKNGEPTGESLEARHINIKGNLITKKGDEYPEFIYNASTDRYEYDGTYIISHTNAKDVQSLLLAFTDIKYYDYSIYSTHIEIEIKGLIRAVINNNSDGAAVELIGNCRIDDDVMFAIKEIREMADCINSNTVF